MKALRAINSKTLGLRYQCIYNLVMQDIACSNLFDETFNNKKKNNHISRNVYAMI